MEARWLKAAAAAAARQAADDAARERAEAEAKAVAEAEAKAVAEAHEEAELERLEMAAEVEAVREAAAVHEEAGRSAAEAAARAAQEAAAKAAAEAKADEPPDDYLCSITHELMRDPVIAADGHTYERRVIEEWLEEHSTSPKTGAEIESKALFPNHMARGMITEWQEAQHSRVRRPSAQG